MKIEEKKLECPTYSSYSKRGRLFSQLDYHHNTSLILLMGDSGYGKTTLVSSYAREKNIPIVWYLLAGTDCYAHIFLSYIKAGVYKFMNEVYPLETIEPKNVKVELELIASLLSQQPTPMYIVLDDYHSVDSSPEIGSLIKTLINRSSPMVTFIIISRARPSLQTTQWKMEHKYMELSTSDLAFTLEETEDFFNKTNKLALDDHELQLIHERTEGWVASYQLILGIISKMNHHERSLFWSTFPKVQDIYDYLSTEVIQAQENEIKSFLYRTSLLPELDPVIINEFLGIKNAEKVLNELLNQHLFIHQDDHGVFRYHRLFRQFLYQYYNDLTNNESIVKDHRHLAQIYGNRYQLINAFAHYTIGKDYINATKVMGMIKNRYNPIESMLLLDGWLDEISPYESFASNTLFLIRSIPQSMLRELSILLEENIALLQKEKSELWLCNLQHRLATIHLVRGEIIKAKKLFKKSLVISQQFHDHTMSALNLTLLAEIYRLLGKHTEAFENVRQALFISDKYGKKHTQIQALDTMVTVYLDHRETDEAEQYIYQALDLAQQHDHSSLIFVYTTMGRLFSIKGDFAESYKWGRKAVALAESYGVEFDLGLSTHELGKSYLENGQLDDAEYFLEKADNTYSLYALSHCLVGITQLELYRKRGDIKQETKKRAELIKRIEGNDFYWLQNKIVETGSIPIVEESHSPLIIRTLGNFTIFYNDKPVTIKRNSSLRLLQYFITNRDKQIEKEMILEAVFPEGSLETTQNQFYVSLSILRKALEPNLTSGIQSRFIKRSGNHYLFCTKEVDLDVKQLLMLTPVENEDNSDETIINLQKAIRLFQGDYFEEYPYESFLEIERERLRSLLVKTNQILARYHYGKQEFSTCFEYFSEALKKDPDQEEVYLEYIELLLRQRLHSKASILASHMIRHFDSVMGVNVEENVSTLFNKFNYELHSRHVIEK